MSAATNGRYGPARPVSRVELLQECVSRSPVCSALAGTINSKVRPHLLGQPPQFHYRAAVSCDGLCERRGESRQKV
jgi:hypothetical protein